MKMSFSDRSDLTSPTFPPPPLPLVHADGGKTNAPAVIVLEMAQDGLLRTRVEPDIMGYILYCHYEEFAYIQQKYRVSISWSGMDNSVVFCATLRSDRDRLHAAAQNFIDFYYDVSSWLVAVPMNSHVINITLQQFHRASYLVKKFHPKVLIKEIGTGGRLVLYCPAVEVADAKRTFLSALCSELTPRGKEAKLLTTTIGRARQELKLDSKQKFRDHGMRTLPPESKITSKYPKEESWSELSAYADDTYSSSRRGVSYTGARKPRARRRHEDKNPLFDNQECHRYSRGSSMRQELDEVLSFNSSSGYCSTSGSDAIYRPSGYYEANKLISLPGIPHNTGHTTLHRARPAAPFDTLRYLEPDQRKLQREVHQRSNPGTWCPHANNVYEVNYPTMVGNPPFRDPVLNVPEYYYPPDYYTVSSKPHFAIGDDFKSWPSTSRLRPNTGPRQMGNTFVRSPTGKTKTSMSDTQIFKQSFIPKLKSPFQFKQNHKLYFETITPTGIKIDVYEGDITEAECDVIVNETNSQLHVMGELAWAVAKHGAFEIPKLTKLHVAMHGPVPESKVMVTPSIELPSHHIIHTVTPKWQGSDSKKSRKALHNTYKHIFSTANHKLRAQSIALPVLGLSNRSGECHPFHVSTEVMYQALISFLKLGSPTLRHIRFMGSEPDQVNLIVTSIKPKIDHVVYDARFLKQQRHALSQMNGVSK